MMKLKMQIIIFFIYLMTTSLSAQEKNCSYYLQKIDSLENIFSVERPIYENNDTIVFPKYFFDNNILSANDKLKIIEKVELLYEQKKYIGLYYLAKKILSNLLEYTTDPNIRKDIVYILIDKTFYTSYSCRCEGNPDDYSDKTKQRLKELMEDKISDDEFNIRYREDYANRKEYNARRYKENAQLIIKKTNRETEEETYFKVQDSLIRVASIDYVKKSIKRTTRNCIYDPIGYFDKSFIPYIESYIQNNFPEKIDNKYTDVYYNKRKCVYALAKLGVHKYIDIVFTDYDDYNWDNARYLRTEEAFWHYLDLYYRWDIGKKLSTANNFAVPSAIFTISYLIYFKYIKVPDELKIAEQDYAEYEDYLEDNPIKDYITFNPQDHIKFSAVEKTLKIYQWLLDNKGKLDIFN